MQSNSAANSDNEDTPTAPKDFGFQTISTGLSVQDYFKQKMAMLKAKNGSAGTAMNDVKVENNDNTFEDQCDSEPNIVLDSAETINTPEAETRSLGKKKKKKKQKKSDREESLLTKSKNKRQHENEDIQISEDHNEFENVEIWSDCDKAKPPKKCKKSSKRKESCHETIPDDLDKSSGSKDECKQIAQEELSEGAGSELEVQIKDLKDSSECSVAKSKNKRKKNKKKKSKEKKETIDEVVSVVAESNENNVSLEVAGDESALKKRKLSAKTSSVKKREKKKKKVAQKKRQQDKKRKANSEIKLGTYFEGSNIDKLVGYANGQKLGNYYKQN